MIKITINNQSYDLPNSWAEVNFKQFIALSACGDNMIKVINLFTGIDEDTLRKAQINGLDIILDALGFIQRDKFKMDLPKNLNGITIPKNLEVVEIGRFEDAKLILKGMDGQDVLVKYPELVMTLLMPGYIDATDEARTAYASQIELMPCEEVMSIGSFFLVKLIGLKLGISLNSLPKNILSKKSKQASTNSAKPTGSMARSSSLKAKRHTKRTS